MYHSLSRSPLSPTSALHYGGGRGRHSWTTPLNLFPSKSLPSGPTAPLPRASYRPIFAYTPVAWEKSGSLAAKEVEDSAAKKTKDRTIKDIKFVWWGSWTAGNVALKRLIHNKHYLHAIDYFNTMKEYQPRRMTNSTFSIIFLLFEKLGSPWQVIDNFTYLETWKEPSSLNYSFLFKAYLSVGKLNEALNVLEKLKSRRKKLPPRVLSTLVEYYINNEQIDKAEETLKMVPSSSEIDESYYNTCIHFYSQTEQVPQAEEAYMTILNHPTLKPNRATFNRMLNLYAKVDNLLKFKAVYLTMIKHNFPPDHSTRYIMMDYYAQTGENQLQRLLNRFFPTQYWCNDRDAQYFRHELLSIGNLDDTVKKYLQIKSNEGISMYDVVQKDGTLGWNPKILEELYVLTVNESINEGVDSVPQETKEAEGPDAPNTATIQPVFDTLGSLETYSNKFLDQRLMQHKLEYIEEHGNDDPWKKTELFDPYYTDTGVYVGLEQDENKRPPPLNLPPVLGEIGFGEDEEEGDGLGMHNTLDPSSDGTPIGGVGPAVATQEVPNKDPSTPLNTEKQQETSPVSPVDQEHVLQGTLDINSLNEEMIDQYLFAFEYRESLQEMKERQERDNAEKLRIAAVTRENVLQHRFNKRLDDFEKEHPILFKRLQKVFQSEVHGEPIDDDEFLNTLEKDPLTQRLYQIKTAQKMLEKTIPDVDDFAVQSIMFWNNQRGPTVKEKMINNRYFQIMKSKYPKNFPRTW